MMIQIQIKVASNEKMKQVKKRIRYFTCFCVQRLSSSSSFVTVDPEKLPERVRILHFRYRGSGKVAQTVTNTRHSLPLTWKNRLNGHEPNTFVTVGAT
ncbi:hypothetical protein D4T97_018055 [Siminovitchia acidinfaciens]|uniref:Uncharacterized protein n=1 Tax=Siminovitchia acidinfaciens TaxID=2321395 RepID=A0A429XUL1_9BACI|nr:hypothetical protein [Siminovitchia acidinfaciens]RST71820.1 hypothetical protein D4T97_018055 [Siminovitchia acidinfaciens]